MAAKKNNFKKALKEPDEFITFSSRVLQLLIANKIKFLTLSCGFVGIVLLVLLFSYFSEKSEKRAFYQLSQTMTKYTAKDAPTDLNEIENELQRIVDNYARNSGGKFAELELANLCFKEGKYDQAIKLYRQSVEDFQNVPLLKMLAKSGLGYSLEANKAYEKAAECFEFVAAGDNEAIVDEALFTLGRLYAVLENPEKQSEVSSRLIDNHPNSLYFELVKEKTAQ